MQAFDFTLGILQKGVKMSEDKKHGVGFVITNPLTGRPIEKLPDGTPLDNKVFASKEELEKFIDDHWSNPVFCAEVSS